MVESPSITKHHQASPSITQHHQLGITNQSFSFTRNQESLFLLVACIRAFVIIAAESILERIHLCLKTHYWHPRIANWKSTRDLAPKHCVSHDGKGSLREFTPTFLHSKGSDLFSRGATFYSQTDVERCGTQVSYQCLKDVKGKSKCPSMSQHVPTCPNMSQHVPTFHRRSKPVCARHRRYLSITRSPVFPASSLRGSG